MENKLNVSFDNVANTLLNYYQNYYNETTGDKVSAKGVDVSTTVYTPADAEGFAGTEMELVVKLVLEEKNNNFNEPIRNEILCNNEDVFEILKDVYNEELKDIGLEVSKIECEKDHLEVATREKTKSITA